VELPTRTGGPKSISNATESNRNEIAGGNAARVLSSVFWYSERMRFFGIAGVLLCAVLAVGVFLVFQMGEDKQINKQQEHTAIPYTEEQEEEDKEVRNDPQDQKRKQIVLRDSLRPEFPDAIAPVNNPCWDLSMSDGVRQLAAHLIERKAEEEQLREAVLKKVGVPREIFRGNENRKTVALTIDTGVGGSDGIEQLLQLGEHYGVTFTFFITGCWVLENPELTQEIARTGHSIGNHTLTHLNLGTASEQEVRREIGETQRILQEVLGWEPFLFRKPQYAGGERITQLAGEYGMVSVQGYPDFGDTTGWHSETTAQHVAQLVKRKTAPGAIWVFHNLSLADVRAFEEIIRFHITEGYEIVRVGDML
jgi:peptidoglycan-N-acetylglucosamine deacetylase